VIRRLNIAVGRASCPCRLVVYQGSFEGSETPQNFLEFNFDLQDTPQIKLDKALEAGATVSTSDLKEPKSLRVERAVLTQLSQPV